MASALLFPFGKGTPYACAIKAMTLVALRIEGSLACAKGVPAIPACLWKGPGGLRGKGRPATCRAEGNPMRAVRQRAVRRAGGVRHEGEAPCACGKGLPPQCVLVGGPGSPLRVRQRVVRVCPRPMAARQLAHKDLRQPPRPGVRYGSPASGEREPSTVSCGQKRRPFTIRVLPRARRPCETKPARFPRSAQPASELWKSRFFPI